MNKLYMGIDTGRVSTKGIIIDDNDNIITSCCFSNEGNPIRGVKNVIRKMREDIDLNKYQVVAVGVTGAARRLVGAMLDTKIIKNEVVANAVGTIRLYPEVRTIMEIGGRGANIIFVNDGVITDYEMSNLCSPSTGEFISSLANKLNIPINNIANIANKSRNRVRVGSGCSIFTENDLINKIQKGYSIEDILAGACYTVAINYINDVIKNKKIEKPIVFNGGVSRNKMIVKAFHEVMGEKIIVDKNSHLMGAFGIALISRESKQEKIFNFEIDNYKLETKVFTCEKCNSNCDIVAIYKNNKLIDKYGNRCKNRELIKNM